MKRRNLKLKIGAKSQNSAQLDLGNLHPTDLRLDYAPRQVYALANGALIVDHGDPFGRATVVPSTASQRKDAHVLSGFLLAGLLDQESP